MTTRSGFFVFLERPFRLLYAGGIGFRVPFTRLERSLMRTKPQIWLFSDAHLARRIAATHNSLWREYRAGYAPLASLPRYCREEASTPSDRERATAALLGRAQARSRPRRAPAPSRRRRPGNPRATRTTEDFA